MNKGSSTTVTFCCPACRGALLVRSESYECTLCVLSFPVLFGIPDFRLRSDRYLTLQQEREKASRLNEYAKSHSIDELVRYYYSITDDVPPSLALRYANYVRQGPERASAILAELPAIGADDVLLDLGCGSGGMLVASAQRGISAVGVDIALRWLVICRRQLESLGLDVPLVCADAETLPFPEGTFTQIVAIDVLEHAYDPAALIYSAAGQLKWGGTLWLSATNRFWPGPHPSVGIWAAGLMPRFVRAALVRCVRGVDSLRNVALLSPFEVARACRRAGLIVTHSQPRAIDPRHLVGHGAIMKGACAIYTNMCRMRGIRQLLFAVGPVFQVAASRTRREST